MQLYGPASLKSQAQVECQSRVCTNRYIHTRQVQTMRAQIQDMTSVSLLQVADPRIIRP